MTESPEIGSRKAREPPSSYLSAHKSHVCVAAQFGVAATGQYPPTGNGKPMAT
jgi:hypothetical protein